MPWYMDPSTACVDCQRGEGCPRDVERFHRMHQRIIGDYLLEAWFLLMNGIFLFMARELGLGSIHDLLGYVVAHNLYPNIFRFSEDELFFFRDFDRRSGLEPVIADCYKEIPPSRLIVLSNFSVFTRLLARLSPAVRLAVLSVHQYIRSDGSSLPYGHPKMTVGIIDSHFHLDGFSHQHSTTLSDLERSMNIPFSATLRFAIQNFVFPSRWFKIGRQMAGEPRLRFTLGIHPHVLAKNRPEMEFQKLKRKLEEYPEAIGIGEVGIDHTARCNCSESHDKGRCRAEKIETQRQFLRLALSLAKQLGKVIVLHIRSENHDMEAKAAQQALEIILDLGLQEAWIHRHCFVGGVEEFNQWSSLLPNCFFSLSRKSVADSRTQACLMSAGRPDRFLLETDSPYLDKHERPWMAYENGVKAAEIMGIPKMELVRVCNKNAAKMYSLPW